MLLQHGKMLPFCQPAIRSLEAPVLFFLKRLFGGSHFFSLEKRPFRAWMRGIDLSYAGSTKVKLVWGQEIVGLRRSVHSDPDNRARL